MVISTEHGCCCIIPREDGYIRLVSCFDPWLDKMFILTQYRLYTKLDVSHTGPISASRQARDPTFAESGGNVDAHTITPDEVLEQANRIFSPYKLKFGSTLSWFSIWKSMCPFKLLMNTFLPLLQSLSVLLEASHLLTSVCTLLVMLRKSYFITTQSGLSDFTV